MFKFFGKYLLGGSSIATTKGLHQWFMSFLKTDPDSKVFWRTHVITRTLTISLGFWIRMCHLYKWMYLESYFSNLWKQSLYNVSQQRASTISSSNMQFLYTCDRNSSRRLALRSSYLAKLRKTVMLKKTEPFNVFSKGFFIHIKGRLLRPKFTCITHILWHFSGSWSHLRQSLKVFYYISDTMYVERCIC